MSQKPVDKLFHIAHLAGLTLHFFFLLLLIRAFLQADLENNVFHQEYLRRSAARQNDPLYSLRELFLLPFPHPGCRYCHHIGSGIYHWNEDCFQCDHGKQNLL